jgi:hypothetical protein
VRAATARAGLGAGAVVFAGGAAMSHAVNAMADPDVMLGGFPEHERGPLWLASVAVSIPIGAVALPLGGHQGPWTVATFLASLGIWVLLTWWNIGLALVQVCRGVTRWRRGRRRHSSLDARARRRRAGVR